MVKPLRTHIVMIEISLAHLLSIADELSMSDRHIAMYVAQKHERVCMNAKRALRNETTPLEGTDLS